MTPLIRDTFVTLAGLSELIIVHQIAKRTPRRGSGIAGHVSRAGRQLDRRPGRRQHHHADHPAAPRTWHSYVIGHGRTYQHVRPESTVRHQKNDRAGDSLYFGPGPDRRHVQSGRSAARNRVLFRSMGVHTNMCVLNRPFAIKRMTALGIRCILVRDLTDAMYNPEDPPHVSHDAGTQLVIEYIEKFWWECPVDRRK